jgi:hypothetical protein
MSASTPFIDHEESTDRFASVKKLVTRAILLASVSGIAIVASNHGVSSSSSSLSSLSSEDLINIQLELSNDYTAIHGHPATDYVWLEEGTLVEPGKVTSVKLTGIPDRYEQSSLTTSCTAVHASNGEIITGKPGDIDCELVFTKPGSFTVQTTIHHSDLGDIGSVQQDVISRYVRREIRKLSTDDLAAYMNAARTLYDVEMDEGQGIYGPNYKSMSYFVSSHLKNSIPDKHHDYMHDGMGFLTQHIAITNEYELALQVVDVSVALPYWDFTQDYSMIRRMAKDEGKAIDFADLWTLDVWGEDYFGSAVGSHHTVTEGRWAYTKVPKVTGGQDELMANAYGFFACSLELAVISLYYSLPYFVRDVYRRSA